MTDERELGQLMRDGMHAHARQISADRAFTENLIADARAAGPDAGGELAPHRAWQGWLIPAAAAAVVALLISSVVLGDKLLRSNPQQAANYLTPAPVTPGPSSRPPTPTSPAPTVTASPTPTGASSPVPAPPAGGPVPAGFRATDLSWTSTEQGWALGTAPCSHAPCTSILRTSDGGDSWVGIPAPPAGLFAVAGCSDNCVQHLRFANPMVGYVYGPSALYLTVDGGAHWQRLAGQADALEIGDGSVLRVVSQPTCAPGCDYRLERAAVGSDQWQPVSLPGGLRSVGVDLQRSGRLAVLDTFANPAGGAGSATSALLVSADDGQTWVARGEPCPRQHSAAGSTEADTRSVSVAEDGSISVLCVLRSGGAGAFTMTSTDGGAHFTAAPANLGAAGVQAFAAASATVLLVDSDQLYRSTDSGHSWARSRNGGKAPGQASYIGFESGAVGRVLDPGATATGSTVGAAMLWTTRDGGASWTAQSFRAR